VGVAHVVDHLGDDGTPARQFAGLVGAPASGAVEVFLTAEGGAEAGGEGGIVVTAAEGATDLPVDDAGGRLRVHQGADGVEEDGADAHFPSAKRRCATVLPVFGSTYSRYLPALSQPQTRKAPPGVRSTSTRL